MAGNFWRSSHCKQWLLDRQELLAGRSIDLKILGEEDYQKVLIFFASMVQTIGEQLKVRQRVIATAIVYFRRFYVRNSLKCIDPLLLSLSCLSLGSKVEEFGVISPNKLLATARSVFRLRYQHVYGHDFMYSVNDLLEAEFFLLEAMDCCLIVYHPYRPLRMFLNDLSPDESVVAESWKILNDSYKSDLCLLYPPYQIALACLHVTTVSLGKDVKSWFSELAVDFDKVYETEKQLLIMYSMWDNFDEKKDMVGLLQKIPKPKRQPSRPSSAMDNNGNSIDCQQQSTANS